MKDHRETEETHLEYVSRKLAERFHPHEIEEIKFNLATREAEQAKVIAAEAVRPWREAVEKAVKDCPGYGCTDGVVWHTDDLGHTTGATSDCDQCTPLRALLSSKPAEPRKCWDPELHEIRPCDCAQNLEPCGNCDSCVNGHSGCFSPVSKKEPRSKPAEPGREP